MKKTNTSLNIITLVIIAVYFLTCAILLTARVLTHYNNYYNEIATAINSHEIITNDGNIWAVEDELTVNHYYEITFKVIDLENMYNDEIVKAVEIA